MERLKQFFRKLNELGIPLPMARDPKTGKASVTLSLMLISFMVTLFGLIAKITQFMGPVDMSSAMYLFVTCSALYLGRKFQNDGKNVTLDSEKKDN